MFPQVEASVFGDGGFVKMFDAALSTVLTHRLAGSEFVIHRA
jgi:hypothetical protein